MQLIACVFIILFQLQSVDSADVQPQQPESATIEHVDYETSSMHGILGSGQQSHEMLLDHFDKEVAETEPQYPSTWLGLRSIIGNVISGSLPLATKLWQVFKSIDVDDDGVMAQEAELRGMEAAICHMCAEIAARAKTEAAARGLEPSAPTLPQKVSTSWLYRSMSIGNEGHPEKCDDLPEQLVPILAGQAPPAKAGTERRLLVDLAGGPAGVGPGQAGPAGVGPGQAGPAGGGPGRAAEKGSMGDGGRLEGGMIPAAGGPGRAGPAEKMDAPPVGGVYFARYCGQYESYWDEVIEANEPELFSQPQQGTGFEGIGDQEPGSGGEQIGPPVSLVVPPVGPGVPPVKAVAGGSGEAIVPPVGPGVPPVKAVAGGSGEAIVPPVGPGVPPVKAVAGGSGEAIAPPAGQAVPSDGKPQVGAPPAKAASASKGGQKAAEAVGNAMDVTEERVGALEEDDEVPVGPAQRGVIMRQEDAGERHLAAWMAMAEMTDQMGGGFVENMWTDAWKEARAKNPPILTWDKAISTGFEPSTPQDQAMQDVRSLITAFVGFHYDSDRECRSRTQVAFVFDHVQQETNTHVWLGPHDFHAKSTTWLNHNRLYDQSWKIFVDAVMGENEHASKIAWPGPLIIFYAGSSTQKDITNEDGSKRKVVGFGGSHHEDPSFRREKEPVWEDDFMHAMQVMREHRISLYGPRAETIFVTPTSHCESIFSKFEDTVEDGGVVPFTLIAPRGGGNQGEGASGRHEQGTLARITGKSWTGYNEKGSFIQDFITSFITSRFQVNYRPGLWGRHLTTEPKEIEYFDPFNGDHEYGDKTLLEYLHQKLNPPDKLDSDEVKMLRKLKNMPWPVWAVLEARQKGFTIRDKSFTEWLLEDYRYFDQHENKNSMSWQNVIMWRDTQAPLHRLLGPIWARRMSYVLHNRVKYLAHPIPANVDARLKLSIIAASQDWNGDFIELIDRDVEFHGKRRFTFRIMAPSTLNLNPPETDEGHFNLDDLRLTPTTFVIRLTPQIFVWSNKNTVMTYTTHLVGVDLTLGSPGEDDQFPKVSVWSVKMGMRLRLDTTTVTVAVEQNPAGQPVSVVTVQVKPASKSGAAVPIHYHECAIFLYYPMDRAYDIFPPVQDALYEKGTQFLGVETNVFEGLSDEPGPQHVACSDEERSMDETWEMAGLALSVCAGFALWYFACGPQKSESETPLLNQVP